MKDWKAMFLQIAIHPIQIHEMIEMEMVRTRETLVRIPASSRPK